MALHYLDWTAAPAVASEARSIGSILAGLQEVAALRSGATQDGREARGAAQRRRLAPGSGVTLYPAYG